MKIHIRNAKIALGTVARLVLGAALLAVAPVLSSMPAAAADSIWNVARGGQLYDNWMAVLETVAPDVTHPAYPAEGKQKGAATWRCKECHGWDYKGIDGAYGRGDHYTGIKGIRSMADVSPAKIRKIIMDDTHRFTERMIPPLAMAKLAMFVSEGQIDMDKFIDRATKKVRGNTRRGAAFYQTICALCHGFDGMGINIQENGKSLAAEPVFIGTVANANPWETLHKIRFGQPGIGMVALSILTTQDQVDILDYIQTLPIE